MNSRRNSPEEPSDLSLFLSVEKLFSPPIGWMLVFEEANGLVFVIASTILRCLDGSGATGTQLEWGVQMMTKTAYLNVVEKTIEFNSPKH